MTDAKQQRFGFCLAAFAALLLVAADGINAVQRVRDGISHFDAAEFEKAATAFEEAGTAKPNDARIAFDRACATAAMEDLDTAKEFYRTAGVAKDIEVSAAAHYNLGTLSVDEAKAILGPDPVTVEPSKRPDALEKLELAILHYRDCLQVDPDHADARHNLELLRLWIKNMQALWREHDRSKARDEMDLLQFLKMLEGKEEQFRSESRILAGFDDSPRRRQALNAVEDNQSKLADEIDPLKEKIVDAMTPPAAGQAPASAPNASPPIPPPSDEQQKQLDQARELLTGIADEAGEQMLSAAKELAVADFEAARESQEQVVDSLQQIAMAVTPFADIVQESLRKQKAILPADAAGTPPSSPSEDVSDATEADEESGAADDGTDESTSAAATPATEEEDSSVADFSTDFQESSWRQKQVVNWSSLVGPKAEMELAGLQEQLGPIADAEADANGDATSEDDDKAAPDADADSDADGSEKDSQAKDEESLSPEAAQAQQHVEQMQQMAKAMERAIELAPQIAEATMTAEQLLSDENAQGARPHQQQAADLLQEIIDLFPKQDPQQNQDQNQDDQNQDSGNEDEQQQDQQQSDSENPEDQDDEEQNSDEEQQQQQNQQQEQQQNMSRQQAESVLRRARERERQHREQKKALERAIAVPVPVERDW